MYERVCVRVGEHSEWRVPNRTFTLLELLVVIAIMCTMMALLMPGLQQALATSRKVGCANNLKQIHLAAISYADDFNGWMPQVKRVMSETITKLNNYINYPPDAYSWDGTQSLWNVPKGPFFCPETEPFGTDAIFVQNTSQTYDGEPGATSYCPLNFFPGVPANPQDGYAWNRSVESWAFVRVAQIRKNAAIMADAHVSFLGWGQVCVLSNSFWDLASTFELNVSAPAWRHSGFSAGFMFIDGRAKIKLYTGQLLFKSPSGREINNY